MPPVDTNLLKYARARDDQEFVWRVAAAMILEAQYKLSANPDMSAEAHALMDWVLDHPMTVTPLMLAFVSTNQAVASGVKIANDRVDTSGATDQAIRDAVGAAWEPVARRMFLAPVPPAPVA